MIMSHNSYCMFSLCFVNMLSKISSRKNSSASSLYSCFFYNFLFLVDQTKVSAVAVEIGVLPPLVALPRSYKYMRTYIHMYIYIYIYIHMYVCIYVCKYILVPCTAQRCDQRCEQNRLGDHAQPEHLHDIGLSGPRKKRAAHH